MAAVAILPALFAAGCCDKDGDDPKPQPTEPVIDPSQYTYDVYLSAIYDIDTIVDPRYKKRAVMFLNNEMIPLSTQDDKKSIYAYGICVDNNDVYVCGSEALTNAIYWKNGQVVYLPEGSVATGIAVKNGNVYVCGYESTLYGNNACCWINNTKVELKDGTHATGITVDDAGRIYVVGYNHNYNTSFDQMLYWTNCESSNISRYTMPSSNSCKAKSVCLDETQQKNGHPLMCIGGFETPTIGGSINKQWIERKPMQIASPSSGNEVFSVSACNGKLYACGSDRAYAKYWVSNIGPKGESLNLKNYTLTDGKEQWYAVGVHAVHDMAFVVGYREPTNIHEPKVWRDGQIYIDLETPYDLKPTGIFVVPRLILAAAPAPVAELPE